MTEKLENTVQVSLEEARAAAKSWATPANLAALDAMTDADIAAQIASNPDAAPELDEAWFERARLVIPLKLVAKDNGSKVITKNVGSVKASGEFYRKGSLAPKGEFVKKKKSVGGSFEGLTEGYEKPRNSKKVA